jgi:hypothetical protein
MADGGGQELRVTTKEDNSQTGAKYGTGRLMAGKVS